MERSLGQLNLARPAELIGEPARAAILSALADGRALPASVLSKEAKVAASTASVHLAKLVQGGLISVEKHGRYRYYRLKNHLVAQVLEALALISPLDPICSLTQDTKANALRNGRSCYDHLAGKLGITIMQSFLDLEVLSRNDLIKIPSPCRGDFLSSRLKDHPYQLGENAHEVFGLLGIDLGEIVSQKRILLRFCMDWSEQQHHLGGLLGAVLMKRFLELGWISRGRFPRAIVVTEAGKNSFKQYLNLDI